MSSGAAAPRRRQPARARRRLLLWDIDGTLLRDGDVGAAAFDRAIADVLGHAPARRPRMGGKTDLQILGEYLDGLGVPEDADTTAAVLAATVEHLRVNADQIARNGTVCLGVPELLERLSEDRRLINGVLTGNSAGNAAVKLAALGLDHLLDLRAAAYGNDHRERNALVPIAIRRATRAHRLRLEPGDVWVIGDTPNDLACARAAGARCLLVASGHHSHAELEALGADATLEDLADTETIVDLLTDGLGSSPG